jgi:exonuclease VII small subunit
MKNIKQVLLFLLYISGISSALPAQTNNFQAFLKKAQQYQSGYLQKDTVMSMPFLGEQSEVHWYYEIYFEGEEAIFLEQVFYGLSKTGHQMICRCEAEKALQQLEKQLTAWESSSVKIDMAYANFQQDYCLNETLKNPLSEGTSKIQTLLEEQVPLAAASHEGIQARGRWLKAEDGHWVLDLSGHLPKGYTFQSFAEDHEIHYVSSREKEKLLYPPPFAPEWKQQLISSGRFGKNIINAPDNRDYRYHNHFDPFLEGSQGQNWNILFRLKDTTVYDEKPDEVQGVIYMTALTDSLEEETGPIPGLQPNIQWDISCDGKTIKVVRMDQLEQGYYTIGGNVAWEQAFIKDASGNVLAEYTRGKAGQSIQLLPKEQEDYTLTMSWKKPEHIVLPFKGAFPVVEEYAFQHPLHEPVFKSFTYQPNGLRAEYFMAFPLDTKLTHFEIERVVDDQGKDLTYTDSRHRNGVRPDFDSYVKHINRYQLNMGYFGLPSPDAKHIIIEGNYQTSLSAYTTQSLAWTDTLHLAKTAIAMQTGPESTMPDDAFTAEYVQLASPAAGWTYQGLNAGIPFQIPEAHGSYYGVDYSKSDVLKLYDNKGHDLIAGHRSTFASRLDYAKTSSTIYYGDGPLNKDKMFTPSFSPPNPDFPPMFNLRTYVGAGHGADKIFGRASMVYHTFKEDQQKKIAQPLNLMMQPTIVITLPDGHSFHFELSSLGTDAKDGREFTTYRYEMPEENPTVYPSAVILRDASGEIVSLQAHEAYPSSFEPYNITFPEGEWGEYTVEMVYYELEEHVIEVPFVITMGKE